jgi:hypothetical protein
MRVWLVDDSSSGSNLEALLRGLEQRPEGGLKLVGALPFQPEYPAALRKLAPEFLDVLVINGAIWPEGPATQEVLGLGVGLVIVASTEQAERFRPLAIQYPIVLVPPTADAEDMWLALASALAGMRRESQWQHQVSRLQQRLNDRIVIERAKGILVQHLKISEEDAYGRLRALSRRQRRQIREIAQSLLDTQFLFAPGSNGFAEELAEQAEREPERKGPAE